VDDIIINGRRIGPDRPTYIIAEISANHMQDFCHAVELIEVAKMAGVDAVKIQTYTPDTLTADPNFVLGDDSPWPGRNLCELYREAYTPWEWHKELFGVAKTLGLTLFSTAYDETSVDFLEKLNTPAYKIASFELVDIPLLQCVARTRKPIILSTGMATVSEIGEAVDTITTCGNEQISLLKCTSAYPAPIEEMNLRGISVLSNIFGKPVGLSDHSAGIVAPVVAVTLGACIIEKHICLEGALGPDAAFSLVPAAFEEMVKAVRSAEASIGTGRFGPGPHELANMTLRKSIYIVKDVKQGEMFTTENIRVVRPWFGMHPREYHNVLGKHAARNLRKGEPLSIEGVE
jgi:pseudaminic acid synthase